jgi:galactokinase
MMRPDAADRFRESIARAYQERFHVTPRIYDCRPSKGAGEVTDFHQIPDIVH